MPAVSKKQQRFMGMVRAHQKGEMPEASESIRRAAGSMSTSDAKDFASTKHKGLPEKKKKSKKEAQVRAMLMKVAAHLKAADPTTDKTEHRDQKPVQPHPLLTVLKNIGGHARSGLESAGVGAASGMARLLDKQPLGDSNIRGAVMDDPQALKNMALVGGGSSILGGLGGAVLGSHIGESGHPWMGGAAGAALAPYLLGKADIRKDLPGEFERMARGTGQPAVNLIKQKLRGFMNGQ